MLRFLENESKPAKQRPIRQPIEDYDDDDDYRGPSNSAFGGYKMSRMDEELAMESGERMDTLNDDGDSYGSDGVGGHHDFGNLADEDKLSVDLDDLPDDEADEDDAVLPPRKDEDFEEKKEVKEVENKSGGSGSDSDRVGDTNKSTGGSSGSGSGSHGSSAEKLFAVGASNDKGLADMETGSEVYMSELLVS